MVGSGASAPTRSRHFIRRYYALRQRIESQEVVLKHVNDPSMPADYMTKWVATAKLNSSLDYATNRRHAVGLQPDRSVDPPAQLLLGGVCR